jgi:hypothetical protein
MMKILGDVINVMMKVEEVKLVVIPKKDVVLLL